jgi:hypothetical protein
MAPDFALRASAFAESMADKTAGWLIFTDALIRIF